jgi:hypothetical protein
MPLIYRQVKKENLHYIQTILLEIAMQIKIMEIGSFYEVLSIWAHPHLGSWESI